MLYSSQKGVNRIYYMATWMGLKKQCVVKNVRIKMQFVFLYSFLNTWEKYCLLKSYIKRHTSQTWVPSRMDHSQTQINMAQCFKTKTESITLLVTIPPLAAIELHCSLFKNQMNCL